MMISNKPKDNRRWEEKFYSIKDDLIEDTKDYARYESGFYWIDKLHSGLLLLSSRLVNKYQLKMHESDDICLWINDCKLNELDKAIYLKKYDFAFYIHHAEAFSMTKDGLDFSSGNYTQTPHGECYSHEFVAWFNDFNPEMLEESDEDIVILKWCDS